MGQVVLGHRGFTHSLSAADAFGDVLPGQFAVYAASIGALGGMDRKRAVHLVENAVEGTRVVPVAQSYPVAVHWVAAPHDLAPLAFDSAEQGRQLLLYLFRTHAGDQGQPARLVLGIEPVD